MKKKLLIIGIVVIMLGIVPAAALNLIRNQGENSDNNQQDSEIIREDDQDLTGGNSGNGNNVRDPEPMEPDLDDEYRASRKEEEDSGDEDSKENSLGSTKPKDSDENEEEDSSNDKNKDSDKDEKENNGKKSDDEEKIVWKDLGFSETLDRFLQHMEGDMTRRNLAKLSVLFYEKLSGNEAVAAWDDTFEDTKNPWVLKAYNLDIIPATEDRKFDPDRRTTRQEGAYIFYRTLRALDRPYPDGDFELIAGDVESIETWAYEAMAFMDYYEILPRRERSKLDPAEDMTTGEVKALWNNTRQWVESYDEFSGSLKAPTGVFAREELGEAEIGWDPVEGAEYYHVYESLSKDGPFHVFNDEKGRPLKVQWDEDYSLKVTGLTEGKTYYYRVRSVVEGIRSSQSEIVKITATKSQTRDFEDYEEYLYKNHGHFEIGDEIVEFESIEITRGSQEDALNLRYYLDRENSEKLRGLIRNGYREDVRTLYGYIIRELSEFYQKDIKAYLIYEDYDLEEYPKQYRDNRIEPDPIGKDEDGTYFVWFPYLEMIWDFEKGEYTHRWFYKIEEA